METTVHEIAAGIYRLSTMVTLGNGAQLPFNQFLVKGEEAMLYHCGQRSLYASVEQAVATIIDPATLKWIGFSHIESDECGSLDQWMARAPNATVVHGRIGCNIWLNEMAPRKPRALADNEVIDLGGKKMRRLDTPHLPHCWDAGLMLEESTGTLFSSDLFTQFGQSPPTTTGDIVGPAIAAEKNFGFCPTGPQTAAKIRKLAALKPRTIALMHGPSYLGDGGKALEELAGFYAA